jgi:hypothetical protein
MNGGVFKSAAKLLKEAKMRRISLLILGSTLASCMTAPPPPQARSAQGERELQTLLAGKVAQRPTSCLQTYQANDMRVIDPTTVAFRQGYSRVYLAHMRAPCDLLDRPGYVLVTKEFGAAELCSGDIARVVDSSTRMTVGSCVFGDFTPYYRP